MRKCPCWISNFLYIPVLRSSQKTWNISAVTCEQWMNTQRRWQASGASVHWSTLLDGRPDGGCGTWKLQDKITCEFASLCRDTCGFFTFVCVFTCIWLCLVALKLPNRRIYMYRPTNNRVNVILLLSVLRSPYSHTHTHTALYSRVFKVRFCEVLLNSSCFSLPATLSYALIFH